MNNKRPVELTEAAIDDVRGGASDYVQFVNPSDLRVVGSDGPTSDRSSYSGTLHYTGGYTTTQ